MQTENYNPMWQVPQQKEKRLAFPGDQEQKYEMTQVGSCELSRVPQEGKAGTCLKDTDVLNTERYSCPLWPQMKYTIRNSRFSINLLSPIPACELTAPHSLMISLLLYRAFLCSPPLSQVVPFLHIIQVH